MTEPSKVLVIGLDAFTPSLVERWVADGLLPNIGRFLEEGAWGRLNSVPNRNSAPAWSSMVTGLNPGKHGVYWFTEDDPRTYGYSFVNGSSRKGKPFWRILSEEGHRVGVMNVPLTFPAEAVNGAFVAGLDSPSVDDPRFTHPPELRDVVRDAAGGEYHIHPGLAQFVMSGRVEEGLERLHSSIDKRTAVAKELMTTQPWDVFMVVFTESDVVQHFFWRQMDDPCDDDSAASRDAIRNAYQHLDRVVGDLTEVCGGETTVMVVSDHGARYDDGLARALPSWLEQLGFLAYRDDERSSARSLVISTLAWAYHLMERRLPSDLKHRLSSRVPWIRRRIEVMMSFGRVDWSRTRAYTDGVRPEIWINMRGRQPQGTVSAEDYDGVRQELIELLETARCSRTGQPLVRRVRRREDVYSGPYVDRSPDLVVEWVDEGACLDVAYPDGRKLLLRKKHRPDDPYDRLLNGGHDQFGIIGMRGPGVRRGRLDTMEIADVAPTILFLRDAPIPSDVDGKVLEDALDPALVSGRSRKIGGAASGDDGFAAYSPEEEAEVRERLRALGYVE